MLSSTQPPKERPTLAAEIDLLRRMARKEEAAWTRFLDAYGDTLYSQLHHTLKRHVEDITPQEVEDTLQGLFLFLMEHEGRRLLSFQGKGGCFLKGWLRAVATHYALDRLRVRKQTRPLEDISEEQLEEKLQPTIPSPSPSQQLLHEEEMRLMDEAVSAMNPHEQLVFQMYYRDDCSGREIADLLAIKPNHLDQLLHGIRAKLKKSLS